MTVSELASWWVHTVTVQTRTGSGAYEDQFAAAQTVQCFVEVTNRLVRDASGNEVVSTTTIFADSSLAAIFPLGSLVTTPDGHQARVIARSVLDSGSLGGLDHLELHLN